MNDSKKTEEPQLSTVDTSEPQAEPEDAVEPVTDGDSFIMAWNRKPLPELVPFDFEGHRFYIEPTGASDATEILVADFRRAPDGPPEMDKLKTSERIIIATISHCVVNEQRKPIFTPANVLNMYSGPKKELYKNLLSALMLKCQEVNPDLDPFFSRTAYQKLITSLS